MATFYIQTDKDYYFAGETVNGTVMINVGSMIVGSQGLALKFTGYECVKWLQATRMHRQRQRPNGPPVHDPIDDI